MQILLGWAEQQFRAMGRRDAHDLAVELVACYEGSAALTSTLGQPELMPGRPGASNDGSKHSTPDSVAAEDAAGRRHTGRRSGPRIQTAPSRYVPGCR